MLIENLFKRDIARQINGVVKADQLDPATVWQELDEFVVTKELDRLIRIFFSSYLDGIEKGNSAQAGANIGVWGQDTDAYGRLSAVALPLRHAAIFGSPDGCCPRVARVRAGHPDC